MGDMAFLTRAMLDGFNRCSLEAVAGRNPRDGRRYIRLCGSGRVCRASQQRIGIDAVVFSELDVLLRETGELVVQPDVAEVSVAAGPGQKDKHSELLA